MKITALSVDSFKRVRHVEITPPADRALVLIGGKNAQGKSSVLDAITAAFGGGKTLPADPVHRGAGAATIRIELDGGALVIERHIKPNGDGYLEVSDADGKMRSPQGMLDNLVAARMLDPLAWLQLPETAPVGKPSKRATLMRLIPEADRIDNLNRKRQGAFDARTEIHRKLDDARGELARLPQPAPAGESIDVAALTAEAKAFAEQQRAGDALGVQVANRKRDAQTAMAGLQENERAQVAARELLAKLERQQGELAKAASAARDALVDVEVQLATAGEAWKASTARRAQLDVDLARAGQHNRAVIEAEAANKRRAEAATAIAALEAEHAQLSGTLTTIDERKLELLAAAKLPIEGLGVTDDGITLGGIAFAQASRAEQYRVALGLAIAASPKLDDVWAKDAAVLDDESMQLLEQLAAAAGKRLWLEVVSTSAPGTIVISDGEVVDGKAKKSARA